MEYVDILVVGAGAAGLAAAKAAASVGCGSVLLADRRGKLGGVLLQCAHRGFGGDLTGPEYAGELTRGLPQAVDCRLNTTVLSISPDKTAVLSGTELGLRKVSFQQLILAAGCREIPLGALPIAGTRPRGVYTAGQAQELINLYGQIPKDPVVILGSGDLGLIMAQQLALAGRKVAALVEQKHSCGGMARNRRRLEGHDIPLLCSATITEILGAPELEGVKVRDLTCGDEKIIPCKSLLIAAGLRADQELIHGLGKPGWLHLCGNCRTIHPMVEAVVQEGKQAGIRAYTNIRGGL